MNFEFLGEGERVAAWIKGVGVEDQARQQIMNASRLPFVFKHIAVMPDAHQGKGSTIGTVIPTRGAIVPAAVGVDIGCGMSARRLTLKASDLPDNLHAVRAAIEAAVPHGRTDNGGRNDRGAWHDVRDCNAAIWDELSTRYDKIVAKHPRAGSYNRANHIGTLGTGNHFIELCVDEEDKLWVMLHSGSRGAGNRIGTYFIEKAKEEMRRYFIDKFLPDQDLAYLVEHSVLFDDYMYAVEWAQDFALANRESIMAATIGALRGLLPPFTVEAEHAVSCHHNYVAREHHMGVNLLVTRKGAVRARVGDFGIIPGSMGTGSFIVRGKGNPMSFCSCSHGAGRAMSRTQARKVISLEQHAAALRGIECNAGDGTLDESPEAYKNVNAVMEAQSDLVEIVHTLHQMVNVKGESDGNRGS